MVRELLIYLHDLCGVAYGMWHSSLVSVPTCRKVGSNLGRHPGGMSNSDEDTHRDHPTIVHSQFGVTSIYKKYKEKKITLGSNSYQSWNL
jgi:hypothetical protein